MAGQHQVTDNIDLRSLYGEPGDLPRKAIGAALEAHSRRFIELSPLVILSSVTRDGAVDISPRGDAPGFVQVRQDRLLAIPDRPGNNKLHTFNNLLHNDHLGLMFMIPGIVEVLRLRGRGQLTTDPAECAQHVVQGKAPKAVLLVTIDTVIPHCGKALRRARFFDPEATLDSKTDGVPTLGQIALALAGMATEKAVAEVDQAIQEDYQDGLY